MWSVVFVAWACYARRARYCFYQFRPPICLCPNKWTYRHTFLTVRWENHSSFVPHNCYKIPVGTPLVGALNTRRWKIAIFDRNRRLSRKRYGIGLLAHGCYGSLVGSKRVADRSVSDPLTLSDLEKRHARFGMFTADLRNYTLVSFGLEPPNVAR